MNISTNERGSVNPLLISSIILGVIAASFTGAFIWAYTSYVDQRNNVDSKISVAVDAAKKAQVTEDEVKLVEALKEPYQQLVGPDDLGRVTLSYPKTWSVYIAKAGGTGSYEAYLHPGSVPTVSVSQAYAARVVINEQAYETVIGSYAALVKKGDLKSSPITVGNFSGIRLDGKFTASRTGSAVIFKIRDKTLIVATDIAEYQADFNNIIVKSLNLNP